MKKKSAVGSKDRRSPEEKLQQDHFQQIPRLRKEGRGAVHASMKKWFSSPGAGPIGELR